MKKAIIYCRVSTVEQAENGMSLVAQERICKEYAKRNNIEIEKIFIERGESAKTAERTELQKMMKFCKLNEDKFDHLLIYKVDRLSRNTYDYAQLKAFFSLCKMSIISVTEPFADSPIGRFMENTMAGMAQLENEIRADRTKMGMVEALRDGRYIFPAPTGYRNTGGRGISNIEPIGEMKGVIKKVFKEVVKGHRSQEEIRQYATQIGLKTNKGNVLPKPTFYKMLRNPIYKGYIDVPKMGICQKGKFKSIVSEEVFDTVQSILDGKSKKLPIYKKLHPDFPLRGIIKCTCGKVMTSNWSKGTGGKYGYYRCNNCKNVNIRKEEAENKFNSYLKDIQLSEEALELITVALRLNWANRTQEIEKTIDKLEKESKAIKSKQDVLIEKNINGVFSDEITKRKMSDLEKELSEIKVELMKYTKPEEDEKVLVEYSLEFLKDMSESITNLNVQQQSKFQKFIFPEGLVYENGNYRTNSKPFTIGMNEMFEGENSMMVTLPVENTNYLIDELKSFLQWFQSIELNLISSDIQLNLS